MSNPIIFCPSCNSQHILSYGKCWKCKDCGRYFSKSPKKSDSSWHQWNKGLSKETDVRVKNYSEKQSLSKKNNLDFIKKAIDNLPPSKINISKEELDKLYNIDKLSQYEIAHKLGCVQTRISQLMKEYNIPNRGRGEGVRRRKNQKDINKKIAKALRGNTNWKFSYEYPNKEEQKIIHFFSKWHLPFKYVGDGSFKIGGKCPDFINEENKLIIEFFGELWHRENDEPKRIGFFKEYGWKCMVIWGKESRGRVRESITYSWEHILYNKIIRWMAGLE